MQAPTPDSAQLAAQIVHPHGSTTLANGEPWCWMHSRRPPCIEVERLAIVLDRIRAQAWDLGARTALNFAYRNPGGVTLSVYEPNPFGPSDVSKYPQDPRV